MINIVIFDDHRARRDALKLLIGLQQDMRCIGDWDNCKDLEKKIRGNVPHVVLMDIHMPGANGIEGVQLLHKNFPATYVIMQTVFDDDEMIFQSILAGAHGYMLKKDPPHQLVEGIREVCDGGSPMTPSIARRVITLFQKQIKNNDPEVFDLSVRELEILRLLVKGNSRKMIASHLFISIFTVNNHIKKIYQRLHVHSVSEAVVTAINKRIV